MAMSEAHDEDRPDTLRTSILTLVMGLLVLAGFSAAAGTVAAVLFDSDIKHPINPLTWAFLALFLLIGAIGVWGLLKLKPWVRDEPLSPSTRKTNTLFTLSGLIAVPGVLALMAGTMREDGSLGLFSNSPVAAWIAAFAIVGWVLAMIVGWWWYLSADEHERDAYDFASVVGAGLFTTVTPLWWVAARAGLVAQPDAMVLWTVTMLVISLAWFWRRSR